MKDSRLLELLNLMLDLIDKYESKEYQVYMCTLLSMYQYHEDGDVTPDEKKEVRDLIWNNIPSTVQKRLIRKGQSREDGGVEWWDGDQYDKRRQFIKKLILNIENNG